jgi:hypothetical protein
VGLDTAAPDDVARDLKAGDSLSLVARSLVVLQVA